MSHRYALTAAALLHLTAQALVFGQIRSATITGTVKDSAGAVVAGASVSILNQETNITANTTSTEAGQFVFPYLPAGQYTITVAVPGFVTFKESGVKLETAQTARVDVALKLSTVDTTVEVQAAANLIQTESTSVTGALRAEAIDAIPNITHVIRQRYEYESIRRDSERRAGV